VAQSDSPTFFQRLRTARSAAFAGIAFAALIGTVVVLIILATPADPKEPGAWLTDPGRRSTITFALNLIPFAGIAFLWFVGVVRTHLGAREDRLFATVFLGSGLLFVGVLFVGAAVAGGLVAVTASGTGHVNADVLAAGRETTALLLQGFMMRMAAVFTMSSSSLMLRTKAMPRWVAATGIAVGIILLFSPALPMWVDLLFPAWILLISVMILVSGLPDPPSAESGD
jgi:hypothetical protein